MDWLGKMSEMTGGNKPVGSHPATAGSTRMPGVGGYGAPLARNMPRQLEFDPYRRPGPKADPYARSTGSRDRFQVDAETLRRIGQALALDRYGGGF